jgi:hypothetical protein
MRFHGVCGRLVAHTLHENRLLGDTLFKNPDRPSKAAGLALQLQLPFQVGLFSFGLVAAAPDGPSDDESGFDPALG